MIHSKWLKCIFFKEKASFFNVFIANRILLILVNIREKIIRLITNYDKNPYEIVYNHQEDYNE